MSVLRSIKVLCLWILYMPVVLITYMIVWLDRKLKFSLPFPRDVDALSHAQDWCIRELKKSGTLPGDAEILEYKVRLLNPEQIFRSNAGIVDIIYRTAGETRTLKCFAKFAPTMGTVWNKAIFNLQLNHVKEINFNQYFIRKDAGIPAPKVYYAGMAVATGHLCLITEYMQDDMEYKEEAYDALPQHDLDLVLEGMASLHAWYWHDQSKLMQKVMPITDSTVHLFESMVLFTWSKNGRKILVKSWCHMNEAETVIHGDARIGNMMFPAAEGIGRFVFIDWQAVRRGRAIYDLAYFLMLSLHPERRIAVEQESIDTYYKHLIEKGVTAYTRERAEDDYRHGCLCVLVLLSLPLLSGEASIEGGAVKIFAWGMGIWRDRMKIKFSEFDYHWMSKHYHMTEQEARNAVNEMLSVIDTRLRNLVISVDAGRGA